MADGLYDALLGMAQQLNPDMAQVRAKQENEQWQNISHANTLLNMNKQPEGRDILAERASQLSQMTKVLSPEIKRWIAQNPKVDPSGLFQTVKDPITQEEVTVFKDASVYGTAVDLYKSSGGKKIPTLDDLFKISQEPKKFLGWQYGTKQTVSPRVDNPLMPSTPVKTSPTRVRVMSPQGQTGTIDSNELEIYLKQGFKRL